MDSLILLPFGFSRWTRVSPTTSSGFIAQQAAEKAIKAALVSREIEIPLTHDIGYLVRLCSDVEELPDIVAGARWLTPWAGGWRYDTEDSPIDRTAAVAVAEAAVEWGEGLLQVE